MRSATLSGVARFYYLYETRDAIDLTALQRRHGTESSPVIYNSQIQSVFLGGGRARSIRDVVLPVCPDRTQKRWSGRRDLNPRLRPWRSDVSNQARLNIGFCTVAF